MLFKIITHLYSCLLISCGIAMSILSIDIMCSPTFERSQWINIPVSFINFCICTIAAFTLFYLNHEMMKEYNDNQEWLRKMSIYSPDNEEDKVDARSTNQLIPPPIKPKKKLLSYGKSRATKEKEKEEEKRKERQWWGGD